MSHESCFSHYGICLAASAEDERDRWGSDHSAMCAHSAMLVRIGFMSPACLCDIMFWFASFADDEGPQYILPCCPCLPHVCSCSHLGVWSTYVLLLLLQEVSGHSTPFQTHLCTRFSPALLGDIM
jgi:hypothetical protein